MHLEAQILAPPEGVVLVRPDTRREFIVVLPQVPAGSTGRPTGRRLTPSGPPASIRSAEWEELSRGRDCGEEDLSPPLRHPVLSALAMVEYADSEAASVVLTERPVPEPLLRRVTSFTAVPAAQEFSGSWTNRLERPNHSLQDLDRKNGRYRQQPYFPICPCDATKLHYDRHL